MSKENTFWSVYAANKRWATHCSFDVLFHAGVLWVTRAVAVQREPAYTRVAA